MEHVTLSIGNTQSKILVGEHLTNLKKHLPQTKVVIITDENLKKHYDSFFNSFDVITIGTGESNKTLTTIDYIIDELTRLEADRSTFIVGIGGGIVCDITGFAASTFMRGIRFGFVSTSLLSMVDASVGGKNGVNHRGYKNMIGVFNQPEFVICDMQMLKTLDQREFINGFAEIIKHAAIKDAAMLDFLESHAAEALEANPAVIEKLVLHSVQTKAAVVMSDEREKGERKKLNFGHTTAHSLEKLTGMPHGEAVAIGMTVAANFSVKKGLLKAEEAQRLKNILKLYGLPTELNLAASKLYEAMKHDKKRDGDFIYFVLLNKLGEAVIDKITFNQLQSYLNDLC